MYEVAVSLKLLSSGIIFNSLCCLFEKLVRERAFEWQSHYSSCYRSGSHSSYGLLSIALQNFDVRNVKLVERLLYIGIDDTPYSACRTQSKPSAVVVDSECSAS